ncbi:DNA-directed DNA polymerase [Zostera marina]|uniref:DNA-directed DNA polymerase n=1 Tax=Zostera marina TaxID=29655 RepID=A0A0K9Q3V9_ZOSMR|nr:DNA-directed DNA polymerase [Zostera marina]
MFSGLEVADQFYDILHKHCGRVQAVSCDEAFLDVTDIDPDPEMIASIIRQEIMQMTRCTSSAGIAENLLLARIATRSAKPNGQVSIASQKVDDYMKNLSICALPGIGRTLQHKLKAQNISTCSQLQLFSKEKLHKDFGIQTGDKLWNYCRGIDNRMVEDVQVEKICIYIYTQDTSKDVEYFYPR